MRAWRTVRRFIACYALFSIAAGIFLGELPFHPARKPVPNQASATAIAAQCGAELQDVSVISKDGINLQAWFVHPAGGNGDAVILFHGVGDNRQGVMGLARLFLSRGYAVLMPDSRGHGASAGIPTYGIKESSDTRLWFAWLIGNEHPQCVFGVGESMGAATLLQSIKTVPFCAVVAESSFANFRQVAYLRVGQFFHAGSWVGRIVFRPTVELAFLYGWLRYGVRLTEASPETAVVGSRVPVLLIHGLADMNIPLQQAVMILASNPGNVTLWRVPNAGHCGAISTAGPEYAERVLGWFESHRHIPHP